MNHIKCTEGYKVQMYYLIRQHILSPLHVSVFVGVEGTYYRATAITSTSSCAGSLKAVETMMQLKIWTDLVTVFFFAFVWGDRAHTCHFQCSWKCTVNSCNWQLDMISYLLLKDNQNYGISIKSFLFGQYTNLIRTHIYHIYPFHIPLHSTRLPCMDATFQVDLEDILVVCDFDIQSRIWYGLRHSRNKGC